MRNTNLDENVNSFINARYKLSWTEHRIVLFLIAKIKKDDDLKEYNISIADMAKAMMLQNEDKQLGGSFYQRVEKAIQSLQTGFFIIKENNKCNKYHWISSAEYISKKGYIKLKISSKIKLYYLQMKNNFTTHELNNIIKMKSTYSARLYEILKQYKQVKKHTFTLLELRDYLEIDLSEYTRVNDFTRKVIQPAYEELPQKSDIYFEYEFLKIGRKYTHIAFNIFERTEQQEANKRKATVLFAKSNEYRAKNKIECLEISLQSVKSKNVVDNTLEVKHQDYRQEQISFFKNPFGFLKKAFRQYT